MPTLNDTHDPKLKSWVASANDGKTDFPIQNLPFGVFRRGGRGVRHLGVAIGDQILDLAAAADAGLLGSDPAVEACRAPVLNPLLALGGTHWSGLRGAISAALRQGAAAQKHADKILVAQKDVEMALPMDIGD
ncbi:MAG TPA: fumarylacetoacetase, partial [Alphaproteobacteria bacterium]